MEPGQRLVALFDYKAESSSELSFRKGDEFEALNSDATNSGWCFVRDCKTNQEGYIPAQYASSVKPLETRPWYFGEIKRTRASDVLNDPQNQPGAFLIRDSETRPSEYSLSVLGEREVKHYRIQRSPDGSYFIDRKLLLASLEDLVEHYSRDGRGLCTRLIEPCAKEKPKPTTDRWEVERDSLVMIRKLGHGAFGDVWEGKWNDVYRVAIKTLKPGAMDPKDFFAEAQIMKHLSHPRVLQLYAVCSVEEPLLIVTELMANGSLLSYLGSEDGKNLRQDQLLDMAMQIADSMAYLESMNIVHRDLAARNILVGERNVVKVADFGYAKRTDVEETVPVSIRIPVKWTAPEAARLAQFSSKSDVWSYGILLTELLTSGRTPYPGMKNATVLQQVEKGYRMPAPADCPPELYNIILSCWQADPARRPSFKDLCDKLTDLSNADADRYEVPSYD